MDVKKYLKLQEEFENGRILEEDMTPEQIDGLVALYEEQIDLLEQMKEMYEKKIQYYKQGTNKKRNN